MINFESQDKVAYKNLFFSKKYKKKKQSADKDKNS